MRLFEQRAQPSFSDKRIKLFACVCLCVCGRVGVCVCVCGTEAVPHKDSPTAKQVEAGKEDEGVPKEGPLHPDYLTIQRGP